MPYSISDQSNLPANVKKAGAKTRRQWIHIWNSVHDKTGDESRAFAAANAILSKKKEMVGFKSTSVRIFQGANDSDLPQDIKSLSSNARRSWVSSYNYYVTSYGGDEEAAMMYAYENTYVPLCDMMDTSMKALPMDDDDDPEDTDNDNENESADQNPPKDKKKKEYAEKAELTTKKRNALSNSSFAFVDDNGTGHLPINDAAHVRNALARFDQTDFPSDSVKSSARSKIMAAAKKFGVEASGAKKEVDGGSLANFFRAVIKSIAGGKDDHVIGEAEVSALATPITFFKDAESGRLRAFIVYSNNFKDKHKEILPEAAHKEYVEWVEKTDMYPEFQLWHCGSGTKWGKADFVDYVDGFAVASGLVDEGKEYIAEALQKQTDTRVSHGFYGLKSKDGTYLIYRSFELSALPASAAANYWTAASIGSKEFEVPFSTAKKAYLKGVGMTDEQVEAAEGNLKALSDTLKEAGIEYKEADNGADGGNAIILGELRGLTGAVTQLASVVVAQSKELADTKTQVATIIAESAKGIDARVEEALTARVAGASVGHRASESAGNALTKEQGDAAKAAVGDDGSQWFAKLLDGQFNSIGVGTPQAGGS